jgi:DinB superfamily
MLPMIPRPQTAEAAPYYFAYINQVTGDDPLAALDNQLEESHALFSAISEEKSLHRYAPDKWSIRQVLNHVTDSERAFAFRALSFARGLESPLPSYDQNVAASSAEADRVSWAAHVEEFQRVRLSTISLFRNMPSQAWARSGIASDNRFTVRAWPTSSPDTLPTTSPCCASGTCRPTHRPCLLFPCKHPKIEK